MRLIITILLPLVLLCATQQARAAEVRVHVLIEISEDGMVEVRQDWSGLGQTDKISYNTATQELGVLETTVRDGKAQFEYRSAELLHGQGAERELSIARIDNAGDWFDVDMSLRYPEALNYLTADPAPSFSSSEARGLMWSLSDQKEMMLLVRFGPPGSSPPKGVQPTPQAPAEGGTISGGNSDKVHGDRQDAGRSDSALPGDSPAQKQAPKEATVNGEEVLLDGDPLLLEFRMLINAASRENAADPEFLKALEKLLLKFYYLLDAMGATDEYEP